ncbi:uncharacterized protein TNIN_253061 [Trichonephila inaurata madagascariensis]|uniref:Uncharacterized protein n=1 Tax=Trichonephila inaurata madagascariensis TaxID=2747483 RepID=A0A8X7C3A7_9ARAC|nr:uncharacterized protein TNIN_253061 [Trichonephila inaurata madagascariensis]
MGHFLFTQLSQSRTMNRQPTWRLLNAPWHCDMNASGHPDANNPADSESSVHAPSLSLELSDMERGPRRILRHLHNRKGPPSRLDMPRLSLLGKPINYRPPRHRDPRYRKAQMMVHNVLDRPRGPIAIIYHSLM